MKHGITLIEVALSILLGSLVSSALFMSFSQLRMATHVADAFMEVDMHTIVMMQQMYRDISGACVPEQTFKQTSTENNEASADNKKEESQEKKLKSLDINTVFIVKNKNKNIDMITGITNNPVAVYDTVKPALARVVYRLQEDKEHKDSFRLLRQESGNLDIAAFEKSGSNEIRAYEVARNIKSCTCTCTFLEYIQEDPQKKITKHDISDWIYNSGKAAEHKMPVLPYALTLRTVFWDDHHQREWPTEFVVPIAAFQPYKEKKKESPREEMPKKEAQEGEKKESDKKKGSASVMDQLNKVFARDRNSRRIL